MARTTWQEAIANGDADGNSVALHFPKNRLMASGKSVGGAGTAIASRSQPANCRVLLEETDTQLFRT